MAIGQVKQFDHCLAVAKGEKRFDINKIAVDFIRYESCIANSNLDDTDAYWDLLNGLLKVLLRQLEGFAEDNDIPNPRLTQRAAEMTLALLNHDLPEAELRDELLSNCAYIIEWLEYDDAPESANKAIEFIQQYKKELAARTLDEAAL